MRVEHRQDVLVPSLLVGKHQVGVVLDEQPQVLALWSRWDGAYRNGNGHGSPPTRGRNGGSDGKDEDSGAHGSPTVCAVLS